VKTKNIVNFEESGKSERKICIFQVNKCKEFFFFLLQQNFIGPDCLLSFSALMEHEQKN
jgi:hypothetical protein